MKFCEKCGNQLDDNARMCMRCGASVEPVDQPAAHAQPAAQSFNYSANPAPAQPAAPAAPAFAPAAPAFTAAAAPAVDEKAKKTVKILTIALIAIPVLFVIVALIANATAKIVESTPFDPEASKVGDYVSAELVSVEIMAHYQNVDSETKEVKSTRSFYCFAITSDDNIVLINAPKSYYEDTLSALENNYDFDSYSVKDSSKAVTVYADVKELNKEFTDLYSDEYSEEDFAMLNNKQLDVLSSQKKEMNSALMLIMFLLFISFFVVLIVRKKKKARL